MLSCQSGNSITRQITKVITTRTLRLETPTRTPSSPTPAKQVWMQAPSEALLSYPRVFHRCLQQPHVLFRPRRHSCHQAGPPWTLPVPRLLSRLSRHPLGLLTMRTTTTTTHTGTQHRLLPGPLLSQEGCLRYLKVSLHHRRTVLRHLCHQRPLRSPNLPKLTRPMTMTSTRRLLPGNPMTGRRHLLPRHRPTSMRHHRCPKSERRRRLHRRLLPSHRRRSHSRGRRWAQGSRSTSAGRCRVEYPWTSSGRR